MRRCPLPWPVAETAVAGGDRDVSLMQSMRAVAGMHAPLLAALAGRRDGGEGAAGNHHGYGRSADYLLSGTPSHFGHVPSLP